MALIINGKTVHHLTDEEFEILRSQKKGGDKRKLIPQRKFENIAVERDFEFHEDYEYQRAVKHVILLCPVHGKISVAPSPFINARKNGCKKCGDDYTHELQRKEGRKLFVERVARTSGIRIKNSDFDYENASTRIDMICEQHGGYKTTADSFNQTLKNGNNGCPDCGNAKQANVQKRQAEQELIDLVETIEGVTLHPDFVYEEARKPVAFNCHKHSKFSATPDNFKRGTRCPDCWEERKGQARIAAAKKEFETIVDYLDGIDFSEGYNYVDNDTEVNLTCSIHADFKVKPYNLKDTIKSGNNGCQSCGMTRRNAGSVLHGKQRFEDAVLAYKGVSLHEEYVYVNAQTPTMLDCVHHGLYLVNPNRFLGESGASGCKRCKEETHTWKILLRNPHQWDTARDLYWNEFNHADDGTFWKIGLAQPKKVRFKPTEMTRVGLKLINEKRTTVTNYLACMTEYYVLTRYRQHSIDMKHIMNDDSYLCGGTECFDTDFLAGSSLKSLIQEAKQCEEDLVAEVVSNAS